MNLISAKIVADSINQQGNRITTLEVVMPRYILAEFNTHRLFSRNSASSRAIPFKKMVKSVKESPFIPIAWQKDHSGMQGNEYFEDYMHIHAAEQGWLRGRDNAIYEASLLNQNVEVTKQLANRMLEAYMYHKVLITATEFENFFNLRCPQYSVLGEKSYKGFMSRREMIEKWTNKNLPIDSLPEINDDLGWFKLNTGMGEIHIMDLAEKMWDAMNESTPKLLQPGEYHIPYGDNIDVVWDSSTEFVMNMIDKGITKEDATIMVAIARCARLSYQTLGDNPKIDYEADLKLFEVLKNSGHFSPFEHVAKCMDELEYNIYIKGAASEYGWDENSKGWCNNFRGFIQYRALLENQ